MANFYSSTGAMECLIIGLARGYKKEYRRRMKLKGSVSHKVKVEMNRWLLDSMTEVLNGYFPEKSIMLFASAALAMVESFEEPKNDTK